MITEACSLAAAPTRERLRLAALEVAAALLAGSQDLLVRRDALMYKRTLEGGTHTCATIEAVWKLGSAHTGIAGVAEALERMLAAADEAPKPKRRWPWLIGGGVILGGLAAIAYAAHRHERRAGGFGATHVEIDLDRVAEMRERPAFYKRTADKIVEAACRIARRGDGWGARKVFLSDLARELRIPMARLGPMLVHAQNLGWVTLARADVPAAMPPKKVADSEIVVGAGRRGHAAPEYHFLEIDRC